MTNDISINIGSEVSERAIPLQGMYSASKHAVKAYTDALRMELEHDKIPIAISLIRPTGIDTPFTEHAVNHLRHGEPSLPDPTYHPAVVAKAIVACAVKPRRDIFIGGSSKFAAAMKSVSPRIADYYYESKAFKEQTRGSKIPHTKANEGLMRPPQKEGRLCGGHIGKVKTKSYFTPRIDH